MQSTKEIAMDVSLPLTDVLAEASPSRVEPTQLSRRGVLGVWAAATLPMAALAWLAAPVLAGRLAGDGNVPMVKALLSLLAAGLVWQFVLVVVLVWREQRSLRWFVVREALWLRSPRSPRSGRSGGRVWLVLLPLLVLFWAEGLLPNLYAAPEDRDFGAFLASDAAERFLGGNWAWFGVLALLLVFNTVLGEELLFRGYLLPRMNRAFGRGDWLVNGLLFAAYHLHMPWAMLSPAADAFVLAYPTRRYRSALIGIAVHSAQSVLILTLVLSLVL